MRLLLPFSLVFGAATLAACGSDEVSSNPVAPEFNQAAVRGKLPVLASASLAPGLKPGLPKAAEHFQITLRFINEPTAPQRAQFQTAARRWQSLIVGDVVAIEGEIPANSCGPGFPLPAFNGVIDDLMINVLLQPIDGPGGILGAAGACLVRTNDGLPVYGLMFFDTEDLDFLEGLSLLDEVIVHEMGHVLGFSGGIFNLNIPGVFQRTLLADPNTVDPRFLGKRARAMYTAMGGKGTVPIEGLPFGPGTANSHWDEDTFFNELMTGFLNTTSSNFINPLSRMTAAAMGDLGYKTVPLGERYQLPATSATAQRSGAAPGESINIGARELLIEPLMRIE